MGLEKIQWHRTEQSTHCAVEVVRVKDRSYNSQKSYKSHRTENSQKSENSQRSENSQISENCQRSENSKSNLKQ